MRDHLLALAEIQDQLANGLPGKAADINRDISEALAAPTTVTQARVGCHAGYRLR